MQQRRLRAQRLIIQGVGAKQPRNRRRHLILARGQHRVVDAAAVALAALIVDPIPLKSADAAAKASGAAITYDDISYPLSGA